jgi:hypothetical protein
MIFFALYDRFNHLLDIIECDPLAQLEHKDLADFYNSHRPAVAEGRFEVISEGTLCPKNKS